MSEYRVLPIDRVCDTAYAKRIDIKDAEFYELVASIRRDGLINPITCRQDGEQYIVIAGHRRTAACRQAGLREIPALVRQAGEGSEWGTMFAENMFRSNFSAVEEAAAMADAIATGEYDVDSLAAIMGKSRDWVLNRLDIMDWPADVQQAIHEGTLSLAAAHPLATIDDQGERQRLISYARDNGATARATTAWAQAWRASAPLQDLAAVPEKEEGRLTPPPEPQSPCSLCGCTKRMVDLSYLPICRECGPTLQEVARRLQAPEVGGLIDDRS